MNKEEKEKMIKHLQRCVDKSWDEAKRLNKKDCKLAEQHSLGMTTAYALIIKYVKRF